MLSLGIKEAVINDFADWAVSFTLAGAPEADPSLADKMHIEGYGTFTSANIVESTASRKVDSVLEVSEATFPTVTPAAGDIYIAQFFVRTTRYQSEFANDFIKQGRPIVVEVVGDGTTILAELVANGLAARDARFRIGDANPFTTTQAGAVLTNTVIDPSLHIEKVLVRLKADYLDTSVPVVVTTEGTEGQGNGRQVEESVRMGFGENVNPYGIKSGTNVDVNGAYSELFWKVNVGVNEKVGYVLDAAPLNRQVSFNVFANENGNLATGGPIEQITEFLLASRAAGVITASAAVPGVTLADGTTLVNGATATAAAAAGLFVA